MLIWGVNFQKKKLKILDCLNLQQFFNTIILDKKESFESSILKLQKITNYDKFIIYENNHSFLKNKHCKIIDTIQNPQFNIKGYLIG